MPISIVGMIKDGATNEETLNTVASAYRDLERWSVFAPCTAHAQFKTCCGSGSNVHLR